MNLRVLFTLPPKPPQQTDEQRRDDTAERVVALKGFSRLLTADQVERRMSPACLNEKHALGAK